MRENVIQEIIPEQMIWLRSEHRIAQPEQGIAVARDGQDAGMRKHSIIDPANQLVIRVKVKSPVGGHVHVPRYVRLDHAAPDRLKRGQELRELFPDKSFVLLLVPYPVLPRWKHGRHAMYGSGFFRSDPPGCLKDDSQYLAVLPPNLRRR